MDHFCHGEDGAMSLLGIETSESELPCPASNALVKITIHELTKYHVHGCGILHSIVPDQETHGLLKKLAVGSWSQSSLVLPGS